MSNTLITQREHLSLPALISDAGVTASTRFVEFFTPRSEIRIPGRLIIERRPGLCTGVNK
ncbi:hypothetical protein [Nitrosomonas aestuarii]|uniref:hypothetical protein n=1 Tax=Nitrosomonas aestuarii TaxID=52441 RepID=UPI001BAA7C3A|nr:hypothetical protein [Nitrosomonas aestuarii]